MITNFKAVNTPSNGFANGKTSISSTTMSKVITDFREKTEEGRNRPYSRREINNAINKKDKKTCRMISNMFYASNPVYVRLVEYLANILCFYWACYPTYLTSLEKNEDELKRDWLYAINYIEKINPELFGKEMLLKVLINGEIFIAVKERVTGKKAKAFGVQELPISWCRSVKKINGRDVVEINLDYYSSLSKDELIQVLNSYPNYLSKLIINREYCPIDPVTGDRWAVIDPDYAFHFSLKKDNLPFFIGVTLDLLDLQDTKDINMYKLEQALSKILAIKYPLDDAYSPVFDDFEITAYHNEIVNLLSKVPNLEIFPTMGEVKDIDLSDSSQSQATDDLARQYNNVYNTAGISQKLMAADNAGTLSSSVIADASLLFKFLDRINEFLNIRINKNFGENLFLVHMPQVTFFNQKEKAESYLKQGTYGYSKFLPAICLGERQSFILASVWFDSQVLKMQNIMIPNASSNTTSANIDTDENSTGNSKSAEERSDKTEQNRESLEGE